MNLSMNFVQNSIIIESSKKGILVTLNWYYKYLDT